MRCRNCDYELWNSKPGACPECGRVWKFEDFRFRVQLAQFLCPHCDHAYAGTDENGLPSPRAFECSNCHGQVELASMRALPAPGTDGSGAMDDQHFWTERARLGRWKAFRKSIGQSLSSPGRIGATLPRAASFWSALKFSLLCASISIAVAFLPLSLLAVVGMGGFQWGLFSIWDSVVPFAVITVVATVALQTIFLAWGLAAHFLLRLLGAAKRPVSQTLCATLYSTGPFALSAVPCCGAYVAAVSWVWMSVAMIHALAVLHRTSIVRACAAVLVPAVSLILLVLGLITGTIYLSNASMTPAPPAAAPGTIVQPDATESDPQLLPSTGPESSEEEKSADNQFSAESDPDPQ